MNYIRYFVVCISPLAMPLSIWSMTVPLSQYHRLGDTGGYYQPDPKKMLQDACKAYGDEPASAEICAELQDVKLQYKNKGFKIPSDSITINYLNKTVQDELAKKGKKLALWTNGRNCIHIHPNFNTVPSDQRKQALAHEVAHCILNNSASLNPQYWSYILPERAKVGFAVISGVMAITSAITPSKTPAIRRRVKWCNGIMIAGIVGMAILPFSNRWVWYKGEYDPHVPWKHSYYGTRKYEEIVCDLLAAYTMKDGPAHGKNLFKTFMNANGDSNGIEGDHPWTSQRIQYHDTLITMQEWIKKFSEK